MSLSVVALCVHQPLTYDGTSGTYYLLDGGKVLCCSISLVLREVGMDSDTVQSGTRQIREDWMGKLLCSFACLQLLLPQEHINLPAVHFSFTSSNLTMV